MIRVCHVITGLALGGAERMLVKLLAATDRRRFEPSVVSLLGPGELGGEITQLGVPLHCLNLSLARPNPLRLWSLRRHLADLKPDLVMGWMYHGNLAATAAAKGLAKPPAQVWSIHQTLKDLSQDKPVTRLTIRANLAWSGQPDAIVCVSQVSADDHLRLGLKPRSLDIIPIGFDCTRYSPRAGVREATRATLGISNDAPLILLAARFHPMKAHDDFLDAAKRLVADGIDGRFALCGEGVDARNPQLTEAIGQRGLSERVLLLGPRHDMPELLQAADLLALSSRWGEAFPNVLGEAMACGTPCVATDVGDSASIVADTGRVVEPGDVAAMAAAWQELLGLSRAARAALGLSARQRVLAKFSLPAVTQRYEALFERLVVARG